MPPHDLVHFVVLPPGHGSSVTDFWGWDAHEAQLHCPDDVSGDVGGCSARRALKPKFYQPTQTMVTAGILPFREHSHDRAGNRTQDLISSQRLWPLDHEAGRWSKFTFNITVYTHCHINTYSFKKTSLYLLVEDTFMVVRFYWSRAPESLWACRKSVGAQCEYCPILYLKVKVKVKFTL